MTDTTGPGPSDHPAVDHKIVYDYRRFTDVFVSAGFEVDLLEYCDESGRFHYNQWSLASGPIYRSLFMDHRNRDGRIGFVSLIVDARKPKADEPSNVRVQPALGFSCAGTGGRHGAW